MKKNIKDYLHLLIGCDWHQDGGYPIKLTGELFDYIKNSDRSDFGKPILRPLSDMTEEEANNIVDNTNLKQVTMGRTEKDFAIALSERWAGNSHILH